MINSHRRYQKLSSIIKKKQLELTRNFNARLTWGLLSIAGLSLAAFFPHWHLGLPSLLLFGIPFFYHLKKTSLLKIQIKEFEHLQQFYHRQHLRKQGTFQRDSYVKGTENSISDDLDIMGPKSMFSLLDETLLLRSKQHLLALLLEGDSYEAILKRQERTIKWACLGSQFIKWTVRVLALIPDKDVDIFQRSFLFEDTLKRLPHFSGPRAFQFSLWTIFAGFLITLFIYLILLNPISFAILTFAWFIFFMYSMYSLRYNAMAFTYAQTLESHLPFQQAYFHGMYKIAKSYNLSPLSGPLLKHNPQIHFQKIASTVSYLSLQSHPLLLILINSLVPWNHFFASRLEKNVAKLNKIYGDIKTSMTNMEVQISLVFFYLFQTKTMPTFSEDIYLNMENGYHPLIKRYQIKKNSITITSTNPVVLITGSNMSGKTTFLRTVGINQMLALMGSSVFADSFQTFIGKTYSCIRISDSVQRGDSYFYTEVLRIKDLLSQTTKQPSLFLIDEIFKGTNSKERLLGSKALIQALCSSQSLGLITTHDIELTSDIEGLDNWHFTDHTAGRHLIFDYAIKKGPATSTNALKIMQSVGLPVN